MKIKIVLLKFTLLAGIALYNVSCTSDKLPEPMAGEECDEFNATYDGDIKEIIDATCALSGCHVQGSGVPGNFTSYNGLSSFAVNGSNGIRDRVIVLANDPNNGMPPDGNNTGPDNLTPEQFEIFKCWVDAGFPEN